jgi:hypothetical protein
LCNAPVLGTLMVRKPRAATGEPAEEVLRGWTAIANHLGQPASTAQRWAKAGMPVKRSGRYITAVPEELNAWLGQQTGTAQPFHISRSSERDLVTDLKRGLAEARKRPKGRRAA